MGCGHGISHQTICKDTLLQAMSEIVGVHYSCWLKNVLDSEQLSTGDNSPLDKLKAQILPTRIMIPRTSPHQDHYKPCSETIHQDQPIWWGIVLVGTCPDTIGFNFPCVNCIEFIQAWVVDRILEDVICYDFGVPPLPPFLPSPLPPPRPPPRPNAPEATRKEQRDKEHNYIIVMLEWRLLNSNKTLHNLNRLLWQVTWWWIYCDRLKKIWNNKIDTHKQIWCTRNKAFINLYTGCPRKNATLTINNFKKMREKMKKLCALLRIEFFSQQNDTKIINLMKAFWFYGRFFWGNVLFKICHFCLKSHNWRTTNFHCLAPPGKLSALALKNEDSMNKEKHSLRNFVVLQSRGSYSKKFLPTSNCDFWQKRSKFLKCLRKMALEWKRLHQNYWSWCHSTGKRIFYALLHSLIWFSPWLLWN